MSIYKKLMAARLALQGMELTKSGENKFAHYYYFELGDFLPSIQEIFARVGLCGIVSFTAELATLQIHDTEDSTIAPIVFTSPMSSADLKGCHPIQNIGAVETYQRRYLWVTAMEIVEHDALDARTGEPETKPSSSKAAPKAQPKRELAKVEPVTLPADWKNLKVHIDPSTPDEVVADLDIATLEYFAKNKFIAKTHADKVLKLTCAHALAEFAKE